MPTAANIAEVVTQWAYVNAIAMIVLVALSYYGAQLVLDGLEALDRWLYAREYVRPGEIGRQETVDPAELQD